ncbi:hypothetical protein P6U16_05405 [Rhizobium sp. 32-5/1]|uniref:hypothetical protein n=1 Tax=Rhizobium sp. 32-5/1 TaxID=3019602 RepID=UPI00240D4409|nr:hypothetical protein [Rhizobium sp. 32-5/1]WEZ84128.1 hypothetical protein P6U16_05405 [Rhizobium sp. 32-5/1]
MFGKVSSRLLGISLLALVAGCNKTDTGGAIDAGGNATAPTPAVIQGTCPQIYLRDGTSTYRTYAKGAKDDPTQIIYQASLADTTRQCVQSESSLTVNIVVQGRVISGPVGGSGTVNLPITVSATDGQNTLYSELTQFPVEIPAEGTAQFVFTKSAVLPGGSGDFAKVYVGFDEGPPSKKK